MPFLEKAEVAENIAANFHPYGRPLFNETAYQVLVDRARRTGRPVSLQQGRGDPGKTTLKGPGTLDREVDPALQRSLRSLVRRPWRRETSAGSRRLRRRRSARRRGARPASTPAPFVPAGVVLVGLFLVPLALMFVVLVLVDERESRRRPDLDPRELRELLHEPDLRPDALKTLLIGAAVTVDLPGDRVRRRLLPGPLRLATVGADRAAGRHRPVLDELPAARLLVAGDPRRARRPQPGPHGLGLITKPSRLFVYNDIGTFIVLVYVYIPFAALVLYASLERFDFTQLTAAQDLGARPDPGVPPRAAAADPAGLITACIFVLHPDPGRVPDAIDGRRRPGLLIANLSGQLLQERPDPRGRGGRVPDRRVRDRAADRVPPLPAGRGRGASVASRVDPLETMPVSRHGGTVRWCAAAACSGP